MELKKANKQGGDEKVSRTLPHYGTMLSPSLAYNAMALASLVHFVTYTTKRTRVAGAWHWRPERGTASFHSGGRVLEACSSPPCLYTFLRSIPIWNEVFFLKLFPLVCVLGGGGGVSKPIIHLRIRYHTADERVNASDKIASATHLLTRYHTAYKRFYR